MRGVSVDRGQLNKSNAIGFTQKAIFKLKLCQNYSNFPFENWIDLIMTKHKTNTAKDSTGSKDSKYIKIFEIG